MTTRIDTNLGRAMLLALCTFITAANADAPPVRSNQEGTEQVVPVEHATYHQLVFANADMAVLNNVYPPGSDSGFHRHFRELFYVVIEPALTGTQKWSKPLVTPPMAPTGSVGYNVMTAEPFIHRVVNSDTQDYHVIGVEIRRAKPSGEWRSSREAASQYVQIFDNPRMRAWRLILKPGQSVPVISAGGNGARIVVRGGMLTTTKPHQVDQILALRAGDFSEQQGGSTRALRNDGSQTIELIEMELK